jgi:hypothetical protein
MLWKEQIPNDDENAMNYKNYKKVKENTQIKENTNDY